MNTSLRFLPAAALLTSAALFLLGASSVQAQTQPISPAAGLPQITAAFNHTSITTLGGTPYDFNYYDFSITGFTNVGAGNPDYGIFSFSNSTLETLPGVVGVASAYLPDGWTFNDSTDFEISTSRVGGIYPDDPQFGLIFIQSPNTLPIDPTGAPFQVYHQVGAVDPFTLNGTPVSVLVNSPVPEASTTVSFGLLLGLGGLAAAFRKKAACR
jgi:hypothetical protein